MLLLCPDICTRLSENTFFFQSFELQCNNMSTITTFWWRETNVIWIVFLFFFVCVRGSVNYLVTFQGQNALHNFSLSHHVTALFHLSYIFTLNKKSGKWSVVHRGRVVQCVLSVTTLTLVCRCGFWKLENIVKVSRFNFARYSWYSSV